MIRVGIQVEGRLPNPPAGAVERAFRSATMDVARFAQGLWIRRAQTLDVRATGDYIRGIQQGEVRETAATGSGAGLAAEVEVVNRSEHASFVEDGHSAFSLPKAIDWNGPKVRRSVNGPYLRIPFRHSPYQTPGQRKRSGTTRATLARMLPPALTRQARALGPGQRLERHTSPHIALGRTRESSFEEHRSARFAGRDRQGNALINPAWKSSKVHGLFKTGAKGHHRYMTIRTITPRSLGWNIPAMHGKGVARQVAMSLRSGRGGELAGEMLERAILAAAELDG